jgi:hypothetical protein
MALYNPLMMTQPRNSGTAGLQLLGNALDQRRQRSDLRAREDKSLNAFKRLQGLEQLGQYQPDELENPEFQAQMNQARMESLGSPEAYYNYQMKQQQMKSNELQRQRTFEAKNRADLGTPVIGGFIEQQTGAIRGASDVLNDYLLIDNPTPEQKKEARDAYMVNWDANRKAMAGLGSQSKSTGQDYTTLPTWGKALSSGIDYKTTADLADAEESKVRSQAKLLDEKVLNLGMDRALGGQRLATAREGTKQARERTKLAVGGKPQEKKFATMSKELIRLDEIISNASSGDIWQKALTFDKIPTVMSTALKNFKETILRDKSGASISLQEDIMEEERYMPNALDPASVLEEKSRIRAGLINRMIALSGVAYDKGEYKGYKAGSQGAKLSLRDKYKQKYGK